MTAVTCRVNIGTFAGFSMPGGHCDTLMGEAGEGVAEKLVLKFYRDAKNLLGNCNHEILCIWVLVSMLRRPPEEMSDPRMQNFSKLWDSRWPGNI
jgi:hypothetical protein